MEENKSPRPLSEEELQKVTGGITEAQCQALCRREGLIGFMYMGVCNCRRPDKKQPRGLFSAPDLPATELE